MLTPAQINSLHAKAMELASRAFQLRLDGDIASSQDLLRQAFLHEKQAAEAVVLVADSEPSRTILLRSAASLALDCQEFRESERLIALGLAGDPPSELGDELRDLLEMVYFKRHLDLRGLTLAPVEFQMSLIGDAVGFGVIESTEFIRRAETIERLLVRTVERKQQLSFRESGAPSKRTLRGFEVYFSTGRAASYAMTVRLGSPKRQRHLPFSEDESSGVVSDPERIVDDVIDSLQLFNSGSVKELREQIRDESYFNNFTALAKKLAPDGKKVRTVGFTSMRGERRREVAMTRPPGPEWSTTPKGRKTVKYTGRIKAADETSKKKRHPVFVVEGESGVSPKIQVKPGMLQDIVKPYWGELVRVVASLSPGGRLATMIDIHPIENDSEPE